MQKVARVGNPLAPMQLVIFGRAEMGTALMQAGATVGIDLPRKVLVWQDADGQVWLAYDDPAYLAERHHLAGGEPVVAKMRQVLEGLTAAARRGRSRGIIPQPAALDVLSVPRVGSTHRKPLETRMVPES